jgi:hypothetical protein
VKRPFLWLFFFLVSIEGSVYTMNNEHDFKLDMMQLESSVYAQYLVIKDFSVFMGTWTYGGMLSSLRKSNGEKNKIDYLVTDTGTFQMKEYHWSKVNHDRDICEEIILDPYLKGVIIYHKEAEDKASYLKNIERFQNNNWRVFVQCHATENFLDLRSWQKQRGFGITTRSGTTVDNSAFYRTMSLLFIISMGLWIYKYLSKK